VRTVKVYCGCNISTGMFDERECSWEGFVVANDSPDDMGTWECPECGAKELPISDHAVMADHDRPINRPDR
jgi:hypothetical protein